VIPLWRVRGWGEGGLHGGVGPFFVPGGAGDALGDAGDAPPF
jgi:hypothetical protein